MYTPDDAARQLTTNTMDDLERDIATVREASRR
jgi:hypothetical protein